MDHFSWLVKTALHMVVLRNFLQFSIYNIRNFRFRVQLRVTIFINVLSRIYGTIEIPHGPQEVHLQHVEDQWRKLNHSPFCLLQQLQKCSRPYVLSEVLFAILPRLGKS